MICYILEDVVEKDRTLDIFKGIDSLNFDFKMII